MNYWNRLPLQIYLIILSLSATMPPGFCQSLVFDETIATPYYSIFYQPADHQAALQTREIIDRALPGIQTIFQPQPAPQIRIFLCPDKLSFQTLIGDQLPEWSEAVTLLATQTIVLKSPRWSESRRVYQATVIHELVHVFIAQCSNLNPVPTWFHEGFAVWFSGERDLMGPAMVSKAALTNELIPLSEISNVLKFRQEKAQLAYQESYLAVRYFLEQYDIPLIRQLMAAVAARQPFEIAFHNIAGIVFSEFESNWREHIRQENRWDFMIDFSGLLWLSLTLLFLGVVFYIYYRNRKKLKEWDAKERD